MPQGDPAALALTAGIVDPGQVQEYLSMALEAIADWRKCEAYRIGDRKAALLAKPYAELINTLWARMAPALLSRLANDVPGLTSALFVTALVLGPAVKQDMAQRRAAKGGAAGMVRDPTSHVAAQPKRGMIWDTGGEQ